MQSSVLLYYIHVHQPPYARPQSHVSKRRVRVGHVYQTSYAQPQWNASERRVRAGHVFQSPYAQPPQNASERRVRASHTHQSLYTQPLAHMSERRFRGCACIHIFMRSTSVARVRVHTLRGQWPTPASRRIYERERDGFTSLCNVYF